MELAALCAKLESDSNHRALSLGRYKPKINFTHKSCQWILGQGRDKMPLRPFLKINGVNGDATADAFDGSFSVDDIGAQTPSSTPQAFSFDVKELKTSAAVSSDIVSSDIVSNDTASSAIALSAGLSAVSAAVPVPASSPLQYFIKIGDLKGARPSAASRAGSRSTVTTLGCRTRRLRPVLEEALARRCSRR
jgi:hypothetical protein